MNRNRIIRTESLRDLSRYGITKAAAAIGVFDGVHRGHQKVLATLREIAQRTNSTPVVITFHPHPRSVLTPGAAPSLLYPQEEKLRLLRLYGAEAVAVIPFTQEFAALSPDQFLDQSLHSGTVKLTGVCVGRAWRFGAKAAGSYVDLERRAKLDRFVFSPVDEVTFGDGVVSSTEIRKAVAGGDLASAAEMLGRSYTLFGKVEHGLGLAGKVLGAATANLHLDAGVLPPFGVYAVRAGDEAGTERFPGIVNIGIAPTIRHEEHPAPKVEVHIFGRSLDLYGKRLAVELAANVRREKKFASLDELRAQIQTDIAAADKLLKGS